MSLLKPACLFLPASLYKVEHVDEVGVVDVPALDADDVHEQVQVAPRAHPPVEHDPEIWKRNDRFGGFVIAALPSIC